LNSLIPAPSGYIRETSSTKPHERIVGISDLGTSGGPDLAFGGIDPPLSARIDLPFAVTIELFVERTLSCVVIPQNSENIESINPLVKCPSLVLKGWLDMIDNEVRLRGFLAL
jgi:hypothetical protein